MDDAMIQRINELSRKKKTIGLTTDEAMEQAELRRKYIDAFKASLRQQLDNIEFVDEEPKQKPH
ncbi:DUF896 domain-containing protein [Paenibacillus turpanensis]|uniref:DUF896 domain-containing protein n=1 Tax=Paenibacillus turpanensis TaxID=2689078 RepID=UPI0014096893|nr:DUF896 domain-containing protein [Paenibacillus turpanensis]